jgi:hypothetical protein
LLSGGGAIYSFDDVSHTYVSITSSLHSIAGAGTLRLAGRQTYDWSTLTVDGTVVLSNNARLNSTQLTVDAGGVIGGTGTLGGPVLNEGTIVAQSTTSDGSLAIIGPVSGSGTLEIESFSTTGPRGGIVFVPATLELGAAASSNVVFRDGHGILILDNPSSYSGQIAPTSTGDQIILKGISLASVTSYSYSGGSDGGTLAIHTASSEVDLHFLGPLLTGNFTLAAGPQQLSSDPASVLITNTGRVALAGTPGDDSFTAPAGNWHFDAFSGNDTITFGFKLTDSTITWSGNKVIVDSASSHTVLTGFETYVFTDGTVNNNDSDPLVDDLFYYPHNHDVWTAHADADGHYHVLGWLEGRDPSAFFSTVIYLSANPDVAAAHVDPLIHFDQFGWTEGRVPSLTFNPQAYLSNNADVAAAHVDPLKHYLQFGYQEGRQPTAPSELIAANGFGYVYYLQHNADVAAAHVDPLQHFETFGWHEGRNPNALFDTLGYLGAYGDVAAAHVNPLDHYHQFGWHEGRDPSVGFDTTDYLAAYPDVVAGHFDPLVHYLAYGIHQGKSRSRMALGGRWSLPAHSAILPRIEVDPSGRR